MSSLLPRLALSIGDPAGIGPELLCRVAADPGLRSRCRPLAIGDPGLLAKAAALVGTVVPEQILPTRIRLADDPAFVPAQVSAACGRMALEAVDLGLEACRSADCCALVTGPANKQALVAAGCRYPGHTEYLAEACGVAEVAMLLIGRGLAVVPVTVHQPLASVAASLRSERIVSQGSLLATALERLLGRPPRIAVLGLNPHAGDGGLLGNEDAAIVAPAVATLQAAGIAATGPVSPDTAFTPEALRRYDGHLCMYHDQGLVVFKALAFAEGVNATLGLPVVRTAPDHGTAYDIAWQGVAAPDSMLAAAHRALDLAGR